MIENPVAHKELNKQVEALFLAFHNVLKNLAFKDDSEEDEDCAPVVSQLIGKSTSIYKMHNSDNPMPFWEHRLLTTLANCQYTRTVVLKNILDLFSTNGYPVLHTPIDAFSNKLDILEKSILEAYLEEKCDPLVGTIEPSMYLGRFDWDMKVMPTDIRPYSKECINNLIHIHSEV